MSAVTTWGLSMVEIGLNVWVAPEMEFKDDFWLRPLFEGKFISKRQGKRKKNKGTVINRWMHQSGSKGSQSMLDDWAILSGHFIGQGWVRDL